MVDKYEKPCFGPKGQIEGHWDRYKGQIVRIIYSGGRDIAGQVVEVKDNLAYLNPFVDGDYDNKGNFHMNLRKHKVPAAASLTDAIVIKPTSKKSLENFIKGKNQEYEKENKKLLEKKSNK